MYEGIRDIEKYLPPILTVRLSFTIQLRAARSLVSERTLLQHVKHKIKQKVKKIYSK